MNESVERMHGESAGREPLMTAREVARYLGVKPNWVYKHANGQRQPTLDSYKLGKIVRFKRSDVDEFRERLKRLRSNWTVH